MEDGSAEVYLVASGIEPREPTESPKLAEAEAAEA
jgi:hypothetical protein